MIDPRALLERDVGTWDAEVVLTPGPGAPPISSRGVAESRLTCGGRWLVTDFKNETGFEGHGVYGWDEPRKAFASTWVDSMRDFLVIAVGRWEEATRTMVYEAEATLADGRVLRWRDETQTVDEDTRLFRQFFHTPEGEFQTMTVTYRRRS